MVLGGNGVGSGSEITAVEASSDTEISTVETAVQGVRVPSGDGFTHQQPEWFYPSSSETSFGGPGPAAGAVVFPQQQQQMHHGAFMPMGLLQMSAMPMDLPQMSIPNAGLGGWLSGTGGQNMPFLGGWWPAPVRHTPAPPVAIVVPVQTRISYAIADKQWLLRNVAEGATKDVIEEGVRKLNGLPGHKTACHVPTMRDLARWRTSGVP